VYSRFQLCLFILRVKNADDINEQDSDEEDDDHEDDLGIPFSKKSKSKKKLVVDLNGTMMI